MKIFLRILVISLALVSVHAVIGVVTMREVLSGRVYDEMDGLIPYIELLIALPALVVVVMAAVWMHHRTIRVQTHANDD